MPSTHRAVDIVAAFHNLLLDLPLVGQNVFKGRVYDFDNTPSHSLFLGSAVADTTNTQVTDEQQLIRDEISVVGPEEKLDKMLLEVHAEAYVKIMADPELGLPSFVIDTEYLGMSEPDYIEEARRPILQAVFTWRVTYRHSYTDPGN